jgi:AraC family transcriptional regulator of adaptative response/methylated-DNA-[protein]-cysteine methyltransferase
MSDAVSVAVKPHSSKLKKKYRRANDRWSALRARDQGADGHFFYSVKTTGVYCYPSCSARPPLAENVAFHETKSQAEEAGFRPCKRCRPDLPPRNEREAQLVAKACRIIEGSEVLPSLAALAQTVRCSPHHFHRLFKRVTGVTPKNYADAHRQSRVRAALAKGDGVTETLYVAGYNSSSRFYDSADNMLGMTPKAFRAGGIGETIQYSVERCCLGFVLAAMSARIVPPGVV